MIEIFRGLLTEKGQIFCIVRSEEVTYWNPHGAHTHTHAVATWSQWSSLLLQTLQQVLHIGGGWQGVVQATLKLRLQACLHRGGQARFQGL